MEMSTEPPKALSSEAIQLATKYSENKKAREALKKQLDDGRIGFG
jgi:hypothetical protein